MRFLTISRWQCGVTVLAVDTSRRAGIVPPIWLMRPARNRDDPTEPTQHERPPATQNQSRTFGPVAAAGRLANSILSPFAAPGLSPSATRKSGPVLKNTRRAHTTGLARREYVVTKHGTGLVPWFALAPAAWNAPGPVSRTTPGADTLPPPLMRAPNRALIPARRVACGTDATAGRGRLASRNEEGRPLFILWFYNSKTGPARRRPRNTVLLAV